MIRVKMRAKVDLKILFPLLITFILVHYLQISLIKRNMERCNLFVATYFWFI